MSEPKNTTPPSEKTEAVKTIVSGENKQQENPAQGATETILLRTEQAKRCHEEEMPNICIKEAPERCRVDITEDNWAQEPEPQRHFSDQELQIVCRSVNGAMKKKGRCGETLLAIPFDTDNPFPLMPIFCFGESIRIHGKSYLMFRIKDGCIVG